MGNIDATFRIAAETLKGVPDEIKQNIVLPLNLLNEQIVGQFNNAQISTNANTTSHVLTQNFATGVMIIITNPLDRAPLGVSAIGGNGPNQFVESIWLTPQSDQTKLGVTVNWQPATYSGPCTFRLEGG
jgi:hypothetical protein